MKKIKIALAALLSVLFIVSCKGGSDTPESAVKAAVEAVKAKNWGAVYEALSKDTTAKIETSLKAMINLMASMAQAGGSEDPQVKKMLELKDLTGKDFFVKLVEANASESDQFMAELNAFEVVKADIQGDKATVTVKTASKPSEEIPMIKEDGKWKIDFAAKIAESMQQGGK
ncbi:MAG: hypothetical protein A2Y41_05730 [Spirochaetes bacterium GWB1_36_13]|nr:MAG: hypothetical protein A2Y41_05730 [Spirochaetes bacterium GWB1_36_13]